MSESNDPFGCRWEGEVRWRLLLGKLRDPVDELLELGGVGDEETLLAFALRHQLEVDVVGARREKLGDEGVEEGLVELGVDLAAVDGFADEGAKGVPGDAGGVDVGTSFRRRRDPRVDGVERRFLIRVVELERLAPSERDVAKTLLDDGVKPGDEEVEAHLLGGTGGETSRVEATERVEDVGADTGRRLVHEDATLAEDVDRD